MALGAKIDVLAVPKLRLVVFYALISGNFAMVCAKKKLMHDCLFDMYIQELKFTG